MEGLGELDWAIVGGFAFGRNWQFPVAHGWVRKGEGHFAPSWSRMGEQIVSVEHFRYFAVAEPLPLAGGLEHLKKLAAEWHLEILEEHPEVWWSEDPDD